METHGVVDHQISALTHRSGVAHLGLETVQSARSGSKRFGDGISTSFRNRTGFGGHWAKLAKTLLHPPTKPRALPLIGPLCSRRVMMQP